MTVRQARSDRLGGRREIGLLAASVFVVTCVIAMIVTYPGGDVVALALPVYGAVVYTFVGVIVLRHHPGHGIGRLALIIGLAFAVGGLVTVLTRGGLPGVDPSTLPAPLTLAVEFLLDLSSALPTVALVLGISLLITWFPDGRRTSLLGGLVEVILVGSVLLAVASSVGIIGNGADLAIFALLGSIVLSLVDLVRRFRRADVQRRTQMKWVLAAMVLNVVVMVTVLGPASSDPGLDWVWIAWIASLGLPILGIAVGITRYHLYDIDRIVSRTIAYAVVSAIVAAVFGAIVVLLSTALGSIAQGETIAVAASTLAAFALFQPVLRRVRRGVDMRFDRARYDADRTVAEFSGRLRGEVDIATVAKDLDATVQQAVNPASVRLWIREGSP
jgi:hypothetical protein